MTINDFSMTKDQYDHICHILLTTYPGDSKRNHLYAAMIYLRKISRSREHGIPSDWPYYILNIRECMDIAIKIQSKL